MLVKGIHQTILTTNGKFEEKEHAKKLRGIFDSVAFRQVVDVYVNAGEAYKTATNNLQASINIEEVRERIVNATNVTLSNMPDIPVPAINKIQERPAPNPQVQLAQNNRPNFLQQLQRQGGSLIDSVVRSFSVQNHGNNI